MNKRVISILAIFFVFVFSFASFGAKPMVLFDSGHAQQAGNADWVITGAYSDFANAFRQEGCQVKSVTRFSASILKDVKIVVLPEPNTPYSESEQDAIVNFVNNGGCLYAISDHHHSDRNNNGYDSVDILNQFIPRLGLSYNQRYFTEAPVRGKYCKDEITAGVKRVGIWGGTTVKCLAVTAKAHIRVSAKNGGGAFIATNIVGSKGGKIVAMGDSSPYDDGSGDPHDNLYNGFSNPQYSHNILAKNTIDWLLKKTKANKEARMKSIMRNIEKSSKELKSNPSVTQYMLTENSEKNLKSLLSNNKELLGEFKVAATNKVEFSSITNYFNTKAKFNQLHKLK